MSKIIRVVRKANDFTLFSNAFSAISLVCQAEKEGALAVVDWTEEYSPIVYRDPEASALIGPNIWEWYFEQPHGLPIGTPYNHVWEFSDDGNNGFLKYDHFSPENLALKRSVFPRLLRPVCAVTHLADKLLKEYRINPENTVAVQFRGNDSLHDTIPSRKGRKTLEHYYAVIDEAISRHPGFKVWIQTDDVSICADFMRRYPQSVRVNYFEQLSSPNQYTDRCSPKSGYDRGLDPAAMMVMLSRCAVMVKSVSNLADVAAALGTGEIIHIA